MKTSLSSFCIFLSVLFFYSTLIFAQTPTIIPICEQLGDQVDRTERNAFHLFQSFENFQRAVLYQADDHQFYFIVEYNDEQANLQARRLDRTLEQIEQLRSYINEFNKQKPAATENKKMKKHDRLDVSAGRFCTGGKFDNHTLLLAVEGQDEMWGIGVQALCHSEEEIDSIFLSVNFQAAWQMNSWFESYATAGIGGVYIILFPIFDVGIGFKIKPYKGIFARFDYRYYFVKNLSAPVCSIGIGYSFHHK